MSNNLLAVVGQGYVGLPIAMRAVDCGYATIGLDTNETRIAQLTAGVSFVEDVSNQMLTQAIATGRYRPTSNFADLAGFDVAIITVPTPLSEGLPDLSYIESAARSIAPHISRDSIVILESTTYPGTTEELLIPLLEEGSGLRGGTDFFVGYSPERIDPGNSTWGFVNTPKVISGINPASAERVKAFYLSLIDEAVEVSNCRIAEMTKLLENTFRHVNIALVNELAIFANQLGIDIWEAIEAAETKPFGFMRFNPGPGVGGHCLPIDPSYLSWKVRQTLGHQFRFVELANDINDHMPDHVVSRLISGLNHRRLPVRDSQILLVGLTYKRNSSDARESPAIRVAELLLELGAHLSVVDPYLHQIPENLRLMKYVPVESVRFDIYDAVVVLTDHDGVDYELLESESRYVLDTRNRLTGQSKVDKL